MRFPKNRGKRSFFFLKRFVDVFCSLIILLVISPLLLMLFILVWFNLGWPVFFIQNRPGKYSKPFRIIKFRTMTNNCDSYGNLLPDQIRTTIVGRFLRKTSLDELPEFINVLKGEMSLVGPRPLLIKYLPYFTEREKKRHDVKPGITGLAQISGRNLLTWDDRLEMDVKYVENLTAWLDLRILLLTIVNAIRQKDVLAVSSETVLDFNDYRIDQLTNNSDGN
jgi:lipopolysaccharide/colanic/teichoic acid biosynthesis glycosyltransferase